MELTPTANPNEFSGTFESDASIVYNYFCQKGDWDYQEAEYNGLGNPVFGPNRTYNTSDVVPLWYRINKITLNASIENTVPNTLFVIGDFNSWSSGIEMAKSGSTFSLIIGGNPGDKFPANTLYKYYTNDVVADNWEANSDGSLKNYRWSISPVMNDKIAEFTTPLVSTGFKNPEKSIQIFRTSSGIRVEFDQGANIELYTINGVLIEKTKAYNSYIRELKSGAYIIRVNGKSTKFIR